MRSDIFIHIFYCFKVPFLLINGTPITFMLLKGMRFAALAQAFGADLSNVM